MSFAKNNESVFSLYEIHKIKAHLNYKAGFLFNFQLKRLSKENGALRYDNDYNVMGCIGFWHSIIDDLTAIGYSLTRIGDDIGVDASVIYNIRWNIEQSTDLSIHAIEKLLLLHSDKRSDLFSQLEMPGSAIC